VPELTVKRTVPFQLCDVKFWNNQQLLQQTIGLEQLQQATPVTLHIENKKNGHKGDTKQTNTFLTYIHSQIASLTRNISSLMSCRIAFHNVGG
jgi:hypothetical protein